MGELETIRTAHAIDQALNRLVVATTDEALRARIADIQTEWKALTYEITARACGVESLGSVPAKRRGRPRRVEQIDHNETAAGVPQ